MSSGAMCARRRRPLIATPMLSLSATRTPNTIVDSPTVYNLSQTLITKLAYAPSGRTTRDPKTTCKECTAGQTEKLHCQVCAKTMPLDKFSKNQRDKPERARCIKCVLHQSEKTEADINITPPSSDYESDNSEVCFFVCSYRSEFFVDTRVLQDFDGGMRISKVIVEPNVEKPSQRKAIPARGVSNALSKDKVLPEDDDDDDDEGWDAVKIAGAAGKSQPDLHTYNRIEDEANLDLSIPLALAPAERKSNYNNVRIPDPVNNPPLYEGGGGSRRQLPPPKKGKWGAPQAELPVEWSNYSRNMNNRRGGSKKKNNNYTDQDFEDDEDAW